MYQDLLDTATSAARAGGRVLDRFFGDDDLEVRLKATNDFVTEADRGSERAIVEEILGRFPSHSVLAEEGGDLGTPGSSYQWLIDPLDGTTNFTRGLRYYCVSVACRREDEVVAAAVLDPVAGDLFTAARGGGAFRNGQPISASRRSDLMGAFLATGYPFKAHGTIDHYLAAFREVFLNAQAIRRCGAAALDLAYTACGTFDGFFEFRLAPWDIAAGALLIEEAGGRVSDLDGKNRFLESGNVIAGGAAVHGELVERIGRHVSELELAAAESRDKPVGALP